MLVNIQRMLKSELKILITGGGSGGHLSVAKALISALIDDFNIPAENIIYVGSDLGMVGEKGTDSLDKRSFENVNIKKYFIRAGKLQRRISPKSISLLLRSVLGFVDAINILLREAPTFTISTGGFVSVPICTIAYILGKPIYLHEQTASVGLSNKIVGVFAKKIYISFKSSGKYFKKEKCIHTGNVIRKEVFNSRKNENTDSDIIQLVERDTDIPLIYISGGSLGSHILNEKVRESLNKILTKYRVILQTGDNQVNRDYDKIVKFKSSLPTDISDRVVVKKYINENSIGYVLNSINYFVGRSGANTVYELGVLKKFALLIPIPWVTHNEQYLNAKILEDVGLANILEEKYLNECDLLKEIERLEEKSKLGAVNTSKIDSLFPTNATYKILEDILDTFLSVSLKN